MIDKVISNPKKKEDKSNGMTPEERRLVEESMRRNDKLMQRLSNM